MRWEHEHMGSGAGFFMLLSVLLLGLVIAGVVAWAVRTTRPAAPPSATQAPGPPSTGGAEQILAERLARGEIEPDDYRSRLAALKSPT